MNSRPQTTHARTTFRTFPQERCDRAALAAARPALDAAAPDATTTTPRLARAAWTRENRALLVSLVLHFYEGDRLSALPRDLLSGAILAYVDAQPRRLDRVRWPRQMLVTQAPALASLCAVSREAQSAAECDAAWHEPYERQFGAGGPLRFDFGVPWRPKTSARRSIDACGAAGASLKERYRQRLRDPSAGDRVEVAWQGRFRLEGLEVLRRVEFEQIAPSRLRLRRRCLGRLLLVSSAHIEFSNEQEIQPTERICAHKSGPRLNVSTGLPGPRVVGGRGRREGRHRRQCLNRGRASWWRHGATHRTSPKSAARARRRCGRRRRRRAASPL